MKKFIAIISVAALLFCFAGCKKDVDTPDTSSAVSAVKYDLDAVLSSGEIPGVKYNLGVAVNQILADANYDPDADVHDHDEGVTITENENNIRLSYLTSYYYYEPQKEENGISSIVDFGTPFDFEIGTTAPDVVKSEFAGVEFTERELTSRQVYFIPMEINDCTALTYQKDNRRIDFVFQNDVLIAVNLVDTDNWSIIE